MKIYFFIGFLVFLSYAHGQDSSKAIGIKSGNDNPDKLDLEFQQFQAEMATHNALQKIRNGHIINPYWGISTFGIVHPFASYLSKGRSCEGYQLKWIQKMGVHKSTGTKGRMQSLCGFSGMIIPRSIHSTKKRKSGVKATQYVYSGTDEIGSKYVILNFMQSYPIVQLPSQVTYYFEIPKIELAEKDKLLLKDTTINLFSNIWYFLPALNEDLSNLKNPELIINDSLQYVEETISMIKKMSKTESGGTVLLDAIQLYTCKYRIQQFFDHDMRHSDIFDNEKNSNLSILKGFRINKVAITLSAKEFLREGYYISNYQLNDQHKGVYFYGEKYAVFYEFNLQYQQAGNYTIENVCLCEKIETE
jgi:hypothetical protein